MSAAEPPAALDSPEGNVSENELKVRKQKPKMLNDSFRPKLWRRGFGLRVDLQSESDADGALEGWRCSSAPQHTKRRLVEQQRPRECCEGGEVCMKHEEEVVGVHVKSEDEEAACCSAQLAERLTELDCTIVDLPTDRGQVSDRDGGAWNDEPVMNTGEVGDASAEKTSCCGRFSRKRFDGNKKPSVGFESCQKLDSKSPRVKDSTRESRKEPSPASDGQKKKKRPRGHFVCDVCNKVFTRKSTLKSHMIVHTGEKPFVCDICSKCFVYNSNLKTHMTVHSREKPYICEICNKTFNRKTHLKTHMIVHTGEKSFVCSVCGKVFSRKPTLNTHMRVHTGEKPFRCIVCGQSFSRNVILRRHMRIHTGEKPFGCGVCGQSFTSKSHLLQHMRVHTGEKPFGCGICGKSFRQTTHLRNHEKTHRSSETTEVNDDFESCDGEDFPPLDSELKLGD